MRSSKIFIIAILLILLMPGSVLAITLPEGVPQSINVNGKTLDFNENIAKEKGYVVYGSYADVPGNEQKQGQYRYLGYDINKNYFTNKDFPNDEDSGRAPHEKSWIQYPWDQGLCKPSRYNSNPKASQWLDTLNWPNWSGMKLKDYLKIQSAPYEYAPGSAEGWHQGNIVWYQTFELEPEKKLIITENKKPPGYFDQDEQFAWQAKYSIYDYVHKKSSGGQVTFRIYKFSTSDDPYESTITSYYEKPTNAELCKEVTINFGSNGDEWRIPLKVDRPPIGVEHGFYITSSESNFENGVIFSFIHSQESYGTNYGTSHDNEYKPDNDTIGCFEPIALSEWQNSADKLEIFKPGDNNSD